MVLYFFDPIVFCQIFLDTFKVKLKLVQTIKNRADFGMNHALKCFFKIIDFLQICSIQKKYILQKNFSHFLSQTCAPLWTTNVNATDDKGKTVLEADSFGTCFKQDDDTTRYKGLLENYIKSDEKNEESPFTVGKYF